MSKKASNPQPPPRALKPPPPPAPPKKNKGGKPSRYDTHRHPELVRALAIAMHTEAEICKYLSISLSTLNYWKHKHPEMLAALNSGKEGVNEKVENALLKRALGYKYEETTVIGKPGKDGGKIVPSEVKTTKKHEPPNVGAACFWLKNRERNKWRDVWRLEHTDTDGASLTGLILAANTGGFTPKPKPRKRKAKA